MKKTITTCLLTIVTFAVSAQSWLNQKGLNNQDLSFTKEQELFYNYCKEHNIDNGKYIQNGVEKQLSGFKQFKRLEYRWEDNIDPTTGNIPNYNQYIFSKNSLTDGSNSNWYNLGPSSSEGGYAGIGRVNTIAFHPTDDNTIFVGTPAGGLWKTTSGGNDWIPLTDQIASIGVSGIILSYNYENDKVIYIGTGDRDHRSSPSVGILKSFDGGITWEPTGLSFNTSDRNDIYKMLHHPTENDIIYAATSVGLYKTTDAGDNWIQLSNIIFNDIEFKTDDPTVIFGGTKSYNYLKIYKSSNSGQDWNEVLQRSGKRVAIAVSEANPDYVYAVIANNNGGMEGIYKSTDAGNTYNQVLNGDETNGKLLNWSCTGVGSNNGQGGYDLCIAANPQNANEVYMGGINTWTTTDGGNSWECVNHWTGECTLPTVHADKHELIYQKNTNILFEANDGGIYKKALNTNEWTDLSNSLEISQMYKLGIDHKEHNQCITGLQDNGTKLSVNNWWIDVVGGDGMECIIDYTNPNIQYASYCSGELYRTENQWEHYEHFMPYDAEKGNWVTPFVMSPHNPNRIVAGYNKLWENRTYGTGWNAISEGGDHNINAICMSEMEIGRIVYTRKNEIYLTVDDCETWNNITNNLPINDAKLTDVKFSTNNKNTIWVTLSGYNNHGVYETNDAGNSWNNISEGLPEIPIHYIVQDKRNKEVNILYAATEFGIYCKYGDNPWQSFNNYLPNVPVYEIEIDYSENDSKLYAATYGRGLWYTIIPASPVNTDEPLLTKNNLWPNPCNNSFCLRAETIGQHVSICNTMGKIIYETEANDDILRINTADWKEGTYFVKRTANNSSSVRKIIVSH